MMEGLTQLGQEEYIWAMRTSKLKDEDSIIDVRHKGRVSSSMMGRKSKYGLDLPTDEYQTQVMASLVPDEVIYNVDDYSHREYEACFLFGDVSGFTELCEKYTQTGVSGPSRMTQVLNKYLGSMVQEVMSHNGDVLKFSGDAFLAVFKSSETESMRDAVHESLDCALVIQKNYGSYLTDVGVVIRVKLAISAGLVTFALIGTPTTSHYVVVGGPIWDVKAAESISIAGDIIVAPAAWHYVNPSEYMYQELPDNIHVKITGVGPNWRSVQKNVRQQTSMADETVSQDDESSESDVLSEITQEGADEFSLRPAVNTAVRLGIKESMRRFIIAPVMKSIDMNEPFEYLTEMRQAVIVFINVVSFTLKNEETVILADKTYKAVCSVVDKMNGCVNKVSLFDKDLMFVVIFGLRGLKHELECQVALRCARECHSAIDKLPGVLSTSIGVTTGKTYCGVFGHSLRREYTVISLIVNKAARLMVNYKGKVTCDRETFLHSKLESRHFILQEYKPLKGISHPGPVYEFKEVEISPDLVHKINACPLLGRAVKLKLYSRLVEKCQEAIAKGEEAQFKMMLIKGEARQGKTRLLDELVFTTPDGIPVNKFTLTKKDQTIPYQAMRIIFRVPLGLTIESSEKEREDKLLRTLNKLKVLDLICVLNAVFEVNFEMTKVYMSLNDEEKTVALEKMIKQLAHATFTTFWVLAIDDCDFMDDWSWNIFRTLFEIPNLFILATTAREQLNKSSICKEIIKDPRIKTVYLKPIERFYLGALACQILDVYAISPELENAIQTRSNGNPGWIESYLITLIQDKALYLLKCTLSQIHQLGLVCPPLYMMARLTKEEMYKWQNVMEERRASGDTIDNWRRYVDTCRDSYLNITVREQMEAIKEGGKVPICVISPNFNFSDTEMELSMDAMILKTFDSLNYFEQLLVKCSAILGDQFLRHMLVYVMAVSESRKIALAVQKLFEIRVLTCARGDFLETSAGIFKEKLINPMEHFELACQCKGIKIEESCMDLPKYASCGYLQFRSTQFREITYNLLTDNQKKDFHQRASRYLERETRKCKACGKGFFEKILGFYHDKEFVSARGKSKRTSVSNWDNRSGSRKTSLQSGSLYSATVKSSGSFSSASYISSKKSVATIASNIVPTDYDKTSTSHVAFFGPSMIKKLKNSFSLTRAFSTEDFTDCQCNLILSTTYAQLIDHNKGAGDLSKVLEAMIEYAYLCILSFNIPLAMSILTEAREVLKKKEKEKSENMWKFTLIRAKLYILTGYSQLEMGQLDQASQDLHKALAQYGIIFPKGIKRHMRIQLFQLKQLMGFYVCPSTLIKNLNHWETVYANNLSECLSHLCTLYKLQDEWENAQLAATWSLNKALQSFSDFRVMCIACAHMLSVAQHFGKWKLSIALEIYSLRLCHLKKRNLVAEDLKCVGKLYSVIFNSRIYQTSLQKAIQMGYILLRLSTSIKAQKILLSVLPYLLQALLIGKHFSNTYSVLQEINYFAEEDTDISGKIWYLALALGIQIETGFTSVPYYACENYFQMEGQRWNTVRDTEARRRFCTVMWLWCIRNEQWEAALVWSNQIENFMSIHPNDSLASKISALYVLEGLLVYLVCKMDRRNVIAAMEVDEHITELIKNLEIGARNAKLILPRTHQHDIPVKMTRPPRSFTAERRAFEDERQLYHLKAYYRFIKYYDSKVDTLLIKATKYANRQGNLLEIDWIEHSTKAWQKQLSAAAVDFWKEHSEAGNAVDFQDIGGANVGFFTLPTPIYV